MAKKSGYKYGPGREWGKKSRKHDDQAGNGSTKVKEKIRKEVKESEPLTSNDMKNL